MLLLFILFILIFNTNSITNPITNSSNNIQQKIIYPHSKINPTEKLQINKINKINKIDIHLPKLQQQKISTIKFFPIIYNTFKIDNNLYYLLYL